MWEKWEINEKNCMGRFYRIIIVFFKVSLCYNDFFQFFELVYNSVLICFQYNLLIKINIIIP